MSDITTHKPANENLQLTGLQASIFELQAAAKLAIEACHSLQENIATLDEEITRLDEPSGHNRNKAPQDCTTPTDETD
ncbi:MAG: hypothetical protein IT559_08135 [Alphaproteobacteria bacterium]|nr:hypothetical protein [Alphaproteobacteria bacterium]